MALFIECLGAVWGVLLVRFLCLVGGTSALITVLQMQAAPVALFSEQLGAVPGVLRLGRATRRTIYLNIAVSVTTKVQQS